MINIMSLFVYRILLFYSYNFILNEGIHLDLDTWIVPGQIRKANLCRGLGNRYTPAGTEVLISAIAHNTPPVRQRLMLKQFKQQVRQHFSNHRICPITLTVSRIPYSVFPYSVSSNPAK